LSPAITASGAYGRSPGDILCWVYLHVLIYSLHQRYNWNTMIAFQLA